MYGIVSIVEGEAGDLCRAMWARWRERYGPEVSTQSVPHITYQAADDYDLERVGALLGRVAASTAAFSVRTAGVGFVAREAGGVTWVAVARSPSLSRLHEALWDESLAAGTNVVLRYGAETWFPHCTMADQARVLEDLPHLAESMRAGRLLEFVAIDNLAVIEERPYGHEVVRRVELRG